MSITILIIDIVLMAAIVGTSLYGAVTLPPGAQLPMHFGATGYNRWAPKSVALIMWPLIGVLVVVISEVTASGHRGGGSKSTPAVLLTAVLAIMLVNHFAALQVARRRGGPS